MTANLLDGLRDLVREVVREEIDRARAELQAAKADDAMLSVDDAAAIADVHVDTIRRWVREGRLPQHRAGRLVRVRRAELEALLDAAPAPTVRVPPRAASGGRFGRGARVEQHRSRRDPEDLSPEEMARRDFGG